MATGKKAFEGSSQASLIAAIMGQDPRPMAELQPMTPELLDWVVKRCLAKDPDERWQSAADLMAELRMVSEVGTPITPSHLVTSQPGWRQRMLLVLTLAMAIIAGIVLWSPWRESTPKSGTLTRFSIALATGQRIPIASGSAYENRPAVTISPDGQHLVYVASLGENTELFLRDLDQMEAQAIPGTEGAREAFFSPDGQWIGFYTERDLKKVALTGAMPTTLSEVPPVLVGASWAVDDTILFGFENGALSSFSASGGGRGEAVSELNSQRDEVTHRWPDILPGGEAVVFTVFSADDPDTSRIVALSLDTREVKTLIEGGTSARYSSTGHLIYASTGRLFAALFDVERLEVTGPSVPVLDDVRIDQQGGAHFSLSGDGTLVYVPGTATADDRRLMWVDRNGTTEVISAPLRRYSSPVLSPDGGRVAVAIHTTARPNVWIYDLGRGTLEPFTLNGGQMPFWSPDGSQIVFVKLLRSRSYDLFWQSSDGGSPEEALFPNDALQFSGAWSPDGGTLAYSRTFNNGENIDIWTLSLEGEREAEAFLTAPFDEIQPTFSRDGKWLAYSSDESGRFEVYVRPFARSGGKTQVSTQGGTEPVWARNGRELFFRSGNKMMVVEIATEPTLRPTAPRVLFEGRYVRSGTRPGYRDYDVTEDGQRFVMVQPLEPESALTQINVILNWTEELKRLVPTDN
jgi:serine/threonine-protein kinase